jgi:hypothetical protein
MQKYKSEILSRQDFIINDPPHKIISQISGIRKMYESAGFHLQNIQPSQFVSVPTTEHHRSSIVNTNGQNVNFALEGSRRLIDEKRLPPISILPGTTAV